MNSKKKFLRDGTPIEPLILKLLHRQNITEPKKIQDFLEPQLKDLPDPFLMGGMDKAVEIVGNCILKKGSILIWGDYDVDGTTATALLLRFFKEINCYAEFYIPNRLTEGYGLQSKALLRVSKKTGAKRADVLITVDNGISAHKAVQTAKNLGYKIIITDHHTPPEKKVDADAILNPHQIDCSFPGKNLAGVGVAFYLAAGIRKFLGQQQYFSKENPAPNLKQFLDFVAVGTVADMVPLDSFNRILIRAGMETLALRVNPGLTALCDQSNLDSGMIRSEDIGFQLAPKINAAGRLGAVEKTMDLLLCESERTARVFSAALAKNNDLRKHIVLDNFLNAKHLVSSGSVPPGNATIISGPFHIGVAGIVASDLVTEFNKPAIVLCDQDDGTLKGSARSVATLNIYKALQKCDEILISFGGHAMAAGMSLKVENLLKFRKLFTEAVNAYHDSEVEENRLVEEEIPIQHLFAEKVLEQLLLLEPHGVGNPQPVFRDTHVSFNGISQVGKDKSHLKFNILNDTTVIRGIAFGLGKLADKCHGEEGKAIRYCPSLNYFNKRRSWQARVIDIEFYDA